MDIFVYSDESGVFDVVHNEYFVFAGLVLIGKEEKDKYVNRYIHAERIVKDSEGLLNMDEAKATVLTNKSKGKLFRSMNNVYKFGAVIDQKRIRPEIFDHKKTKQRYLDYAYKIAVKRCFEAMINHKIIDPDEVRNIFFFADEHSTATNGRYELQEALERELKMGTFNFNWIKYYPPLFPDMDGVSVKFCDSASRPLVRAADIVANHLFHDAVSGRNYQNQRNNFIITRLPW